MTTQPSQEMVNKLKKNLDFANKRVATLQKDIHAAGNPAYNFWVGRRSGLVAALSLVQETAEVELWDYTEKDFELA